jgi:hypothetical protein
MDPRNGRANVQSDWKATIKEHHQQAPSLDKDTLL